MERTQFHTEFTRALADAESAFDAGRPDWIQTTAEVADYFLQAVPPIYGPGCFGCGEAFAHNAVGDPVYLTFRNVWRRSNKAECRYCTRAEIENAIGRYARSVETGWQGKVVGDNGEKGLDLMLKMQGVNELCRTIAGGDLEAHLDSDDVQWFAPADLNFVKVIDAPDHGPVARVER